MAEPCFDSRANIIPIRHPDIFYFFILEAARVSRLFTCLVFASLFVGCYPQPEVVPVEVTPQDVERMSNALNPDGTPVIQRGPAAEKKPGVR